MLARVYRIDHDIDNASEQKLGIVYAGKGVNFVDDVTGIETINLDKHFLENPYTYLFRVSGKSMEPTVKDGAIVVVSTNIEPTEGKIIIASINGELMLKRIKSNKNKIVLASDNREFPDIVLDKFSENTVWGVVKSVHQEL